MSTKARTAQAAGIAGRRIGTPIVAAAVFLAVLLAPPAAVVWAAWVSLNPQEPVWWVAAAAAGGSVTAAYVSWRRVASDLRPEATRAASAGSVVAKVASDAAQAKGLIGKWLGAGTNSGADLLDKASALVTVILAVAAVGLAPGWAWAYALGLGPVAAWTVARRAGAWRNVSLRPKDLLPHLVAGVVGFAVGALGLGAAQWWLHDGLVEFGAAATLGVAVCGLTAGIPATSRRLAEARRRMCLSGPLAKALEVSDKTLAGLRWFIDGATVVVQGPLPAAALIGEAKLEVNVGEWLPDYTVIEATTARIVLGPVSTETATQRASLQASGGLLIGQFDEPTYPTESAAFADLDLTTTWARQSTTERPTGADRGANDE